MALFKGKVAVITGAGRGIGREEALLMAKHGAKVVVNDLGGHFDGTGQSRSPAEDVVKEIRSAGGEAVANFESVTDFKSAKRIIDCAIDNFGKLNIVVNNAGILRDRMIFNMSEEDWDAVIAVHLKGTLQRRPPRAAPTGASSTRPATCSTAASSTPAPIRACWATRDRAITARRRPRSRRWRSSSIARWPLRRHRQRDRAGRAHAPDRRRDAADRRQHGAEGRASGTRSRPANVAPLVAWLASDDAKDVHGEVFRVGIGNVWLMHGWHSRRARSRSRARCGIRRSSAPSVKEELAKGVTKKESMGEVMAGGV